MNKENFNDPGTLLFFRNNEENILFPFTSMGEKFRGGMFWCLPNQGKPTFPFSAQNGEYRRAEGVSKVLEGPWGKISSTVSWESAETSLTTKAVITALTDSHLRPGLHPYFPVGNDFQIHIDGKLFGKEDIPLDEPIYVATNIREANLATNGNTVRISFGVDRHVENYFCIWTDNKERYVCIEPVSGGTLTEGIPLPFILNAGETVTIASTVTYR